MRARADDTEFGIRYALQLVIGSQCRPVVDVVNALAALESRSGTTAAQQQYNLGYTDGKLTRALMAAACLT